MHQKVKREPPPAGVEFRSNRRSSTAHKSEGGGCARRLHVVQLDDPTDDDDGDDNQDVRVVTEKKADGTFVIVALEFA